MFVVSYAVKLKLKDNNYQILWRASSPDEQDHISTLSRITSNTLKKLCLVRPTSQFCDQTLHM